LRRRIKVVSLVLISISVSIAAISCGAKRERRELLEFARAVELAKPGGEKLFERFNALGKLTANDAQKLVMEMAQLAVDIDGFLEPVRKMKPKSKEVEKLRTEYLLVWETLQSYMRMMLEVMTKRDPRLIATLQDKIKEKTVIFQNAVQRFDTDYSTMMTRYGIRLEEISAAQGTPRGGPAPFTQSPEGDTRPMGPRLFSPSSGASP
jgi:hypothetical protein